MYRYACAALLGIFVLSCTPRVHHISSTFEKQTSPAPPDYSLRSHWAALPDKQDAADSIPLKSGLQDEQASAAADVFFVYPTIYTGTPREKHPWNADVYDSVLNRQIQLTTILNQATVFNGSCRVFAPYYRQAHLDAFFTSSTSDGQAALELAYEDVKAAFLFYLSQYNQGRPLVIASHSQGSYHAMRLIKDFVDGKELQQRLVVAYLVGRAIPKDAFSQVLPGGKPDEPGVWISWNTFGRGYVPKSYDRNYSNALSVNPLVWSMDEEYADRTLNRGGVDRKFTVVPQATDAQNHRNMLWINRPYVSGRWLLPNRVWHRADINLFYLNIRENVAVRLRTFLASK